METNKAEVNADKKQKSNREDKQAVAKVEEQIEKLLKTFGNSLSIEQKIGKLAKNFIELERENNKKAVALKQCEKILEKEQREKEHLQKEYNKGILMRDKLEQVCREQQKLMKSIKNESMTKIRDEEEKRKETQAHFQQSINEIYSTLGKNNDENIKIKEANIEMTKKFKYLAEQYELREKQLEKLNEQIKLETQLNEAKLAKLQVESTIEREILLKEKQAALEEILTTKKALKEVEIREFLLKDQLRIYTEKYDEFQNSLQKSNNIFVTYKSEIEKMGKRVKTLEKESFEWRVKYEKCNRALLDMATDKHAQDAYVGKASRQLGQLQKLCRTLQAERASLLGTLKANDIERPSMPELPPEPVDIELPPRPSDKLDSMTRNCEELKQTLAQLQGQMNAMNVKEKGKKTQDSSSSANTGNNKKAKSKKNKSKCEQKAEKEMSNSTDKEAPEQVPNFESTNENPKSDENESGSTTAENQTENAKFENETDSNENDDKAAQLSDSSEPIENGNNKVQPEEVVDAAA